MGDILISPSMLAADFRDLASDLARIESADLLHIDIMDGHFVPNISFGPMIVKYAQQCTSLPLDVHLMVSNADAYIEQFAKLKPAYITVHYEACTHLQRSVSSIRELGVKAGIALNPHTPLENLEYVLDDIDLFLVMTVNPGFGGQKFIPAMLNKIARAHELIGDRDIRLEVDGGISLENIGNVTRAGADTIVAGSAIFSQSDPAAYINQMRTVSN